MGNLMEINSGTKLIAPVVDVTYYYKNKALLMLDHLDRIGEKYMTDEDMARLKNLWKSYNKVAKDPKTHAEIHNVPVQVELEIDHEYEDANYTLNIDSDEFKRAEADAVFCNVLNQIYNLYRRYTSEEIVLPNIASRK